MRTLSNGNKNIFQFCTTYDGIFSPHGAFSPLLAAFLSVTCGGGKEKSVLIFHDVAHTVDKDFNKCILGVCISLFIPSKIPRISSGRTTAMRYNHFILVWEKINNKILVFLNVCVYMKGVYMKGARPNNTNSWAVGKVSVGSEMYVTEESRYRYTVGFVVLDRYDRVHAWQNS